jgi:EAL domain-containing protein (putative c-di-GMP-specific phosphodiesterase class I)
MPHPTFDQIKAALCHGDICLHYQPVVDLASREVVGYEALARWGTMPAPEIARVVEAAGLTLLWVRQQISEIDVVLARIHPPLWVSLNIAQAQIKLPGLSALLNSSPHRLGLQVEVLESVQLDAESADILRQLKAHHILKADDVGSTDYSWMSRVIGEYADLFHELKLCRGLTQNILKDRRTATACRHILGLANDLSLATIAEWVQTEPQARQLQRWGCDAGQGELFGMPAPWETISKRRDG